MFRETSAVETETSQETHKFCLYLKNKRGLKLMFRNLDVLTIINIKSSGWWCEVQPCTAAVNRVFVVNSQLSKHFKHAELRALLQFRR